MLHDRARDSDFPTMVQLATLTIWPLCLAVAIVGVVVPYRLADQAPSLAAKSLTIDVSTAAPSVASLPERAAVKTEIAAPSIPTPPAPLVVARPAPAIAFAVPTPVMPTLTAPAVAAPANPIAAHDSAISPSPPANAVRHLVFGQGEAQCIRLDYPDEAHLDGEEGVVGIQFTQDAGGHVTEAHIITACHWPILNQAALRAVRKAAFPTGGAGQYDVHIRFKLE